MLFLLWLVAAQSLTLPAEIVGGVGEFVTVRPQTSAALVRFIALDAGLSVFPADLLSDKTATVVSSPTAGRYRLLAWLADPTTLPVITSVVIGGKPGPVIPPVIPDADPFRLSVRAIFGSIADPAKTANAAALAAAYRTAVELCNDTSLTTTGDLYGAIRAATSKALPDGVLVPVRDRIRTELNGALPSDPATLLTSSVRQSIAAQFGRVAGVIEGLK
jgi:hypothetical protein